MRIVTALALLIAFGASAEAQRESPVNNLGTPQVSVLVTATQVAVARKRASVTVENLGTNQVCLGSSAAVTLATGLCLPGTVGASVTMPDYSGPVYGIASGSTTTVSVMDLY